MTKRATNSIGRFPSIEYILWSLRTVRISLGACLTSRSGGILGPGYSD